MPGAWTPKIILSGMMDRSSISDLKKLGLSQFGHLCVYEALLSNKHGTATVTSQQERHVSQGHYLIPVI